MNSLELSFFEFLLQLVSGIIFFVSQFFTISMFIRSSLLDDILWERKKIHRVFNDFSIDRCFFLQEMTACAVEYTNVPV